MSRVVTSRDVMRWWRSGDPQLAPSGDPGAALTHLDAIRVAPGSPEQAAVEEVRSHLRREGAALAGRGTAPGHLTASALVVHHDRTRFVVLHHRKLRRWLQPGGHADGDHELAGVALREVAEETGIVDLAVLVPAIRVDVHRVDHGDHLGAHLHLDVQFLVSAPPEAELQGNHESTELRWATRSDLSALGADTSLDGLVHAGLALARSAPPPPWGWRH